MEGLRKTEKEVASTIEEDIVYIENLQNTVKDIFSKVKTSEEIMNPIEGVDSDIPSAISPNTDDFEEITVDETNIVSGYPYEDSNREPGREHSSLRETEACKKGLGIHIELSNQISTRKDI
ncbi:unnamed protein product [Lepeophtheirus salmonis]|uniref:(salmon louse) hypothetical protein n=1 Tax=Lepeophtheirus salmonis TaxID=72036 RepID=A0A7R8CJC3_LEPSM|nr:unnamed protein product [Lepeophtheirus salmonis]CAF2834207.1 unnamed protein product [Lepeophtheirus salmonis]